MTKILIMEEKKITFFDFIEFVTSVSLKKRVAAYPDCEGDHPRGGNPFNYNGRAAWVPEITAEKMVRVQMDTAWVHDFIGATFG